MTTLLEIKPYIHDFIEYHLDSSFSDKVYWIGERQDIPEYPYCMLSVIAENKDKRTSHHNGNLTDNDRKEKIITRYKTCTITVAIYNAWVGSTYDAMDRDEAKEFAYEQIDYLEGAFENFPINKKFSVQNISSIRPLHDVVDGGYMYRFEFDLTIGYNEPFIVEKEIGQGVNGEIVVDDIVNQFEVTIDNNDNIEIEII